jgi:hypothetical protein
MISPVKSLCPIIILQALINQAFEIQFAQKLMHAQFEEIKC